MFVPSVEWFLLEPPQTCEVVAMILRGAPSHCDGHGRCGFLSPACYHWLTPFITSPFCFFRHGLDSTPPEHSISVPGEWPCVIRQNPIGWSHGLEKKGLACVSCESVPYVMDVLGNRGRHHLDGRRVAVRHYNAVRATNGIFARKETTGHRWKTRAACPTASRVTANEPR